MREKRAHRIKGSTQTIVTVSVMDCLFYGLRGGDRGIQNLMIVDQQEAQQVVNLLVRLLG